MVGEHGLCEICVTFNTHTPSTQRENITVDQITEFLECCLWMALNIVGESLVSLKNPIIAILGQGLLIGWEIAICPPVGFNHVFILVWNVLIGETPATVPTGLLILRPNHPISPTPHVINARSNRRQAIVRTPLPSYFPEKPHIRPSYMKSNLRRKVSEMTNKHDGVSFQEFISVIGNDDVLIIQATQGKVKLPSR